MSRGNQREKAREKNAKKQAQQKKKQEGDPKKRLEDQAEIMRKKQAQGKFQLPSTFYSLNGAVKYVVYL